MGRSSCFEEASWREGRELLPWRSRGWEPVLLRDVKRRKPTRRPSVSPITRPRRAMGGEVSGWEDWTMECGRGTSGKFN